jgi:hypothetical protein
MIRALKTHNKLLLISVLGFFFFLEDGRAQSPFTAFIDTYYAWDFKPAANRRRIYTTQPLKHDTFSTNLAMIGYKIEKTNMRANLTLQSGDSVDTNYKSEPKEGQSVKNFQEAYAGVKVSDETWLDAGIYLGHIGNESWISGHNWTYSRSLQLDYVPYYTAGMRLSGKDGKNTWQLHLMNGWQSISDQNSSKTVGTQYSWHKEKYSITYNTQVGQEIFPGRNTSGLRTYQNLHWEIPGRFIDWKMAIDIGTQNVPGEKKALVWGSTASQWRWRYDEKWTFAGKLEYFYDAKGAINPTGTPGNFRVAGASMNADYKWENGLVSRLEFRKLQAADPIYPHGSTYGYSDTFIVSSLSYQF